MSEEKPTPVGEGEVSPAAAKEITAVLLASARKKRAVERTSAESKAMQDYNRKIKKASRSKKRDQAGSDNKIKQKEAIEILLERGLRNRHVIDFCVNTLAPAACRNLKTDGDNIPYNRHLFTQGLRATLNDTETPKVEDGEVEGEIL